MREDDFRVSPLERRLEFHKFIDEVCDLFERVRRMSPEELREQREERWRDPAEVMFELDAYWTAYLDQRQAALKERQG